MNRRFILILIQVAVLFLAGCLITDNASQNNTGTLNEGMLTTVGNCTETDDGVDYYAIGMTTSGKMKATDQCLNEETIEEYSCGTDGSIQTDYYNCSFGCASGRCNIDLQSFPTVPFSIAYIPIIITCNDTDGGKDYYEKGTVINSTATGTDYCRGIILTERYCKTDKSIGLDTHVCPNGCTDGRCKSSIPPLPPRAITCTETDDGIDYYKKGTTVSTSSAGRTGVTDFCVGDILTEKYCKSDKSIGSKNYTCAYGCSDGECKPAPPTCTDSDGGLTYSVSGKTTLTGATPFTQFDSCEEDDGDITEWYCPTSSTRSSIVHHCPYGCTPNQNYCNPAPPTCTDSDGGQDILVQGTTSDSTGAAGIDSCVDSDTVKEYYCTASKILSDVNLDCNSKYGCLDGKCQPLCSDSDDGSYYEAGTVTFGSITHTDSCSSITTLNEWRCYPNLFDGPISLLIECLNGCTAGACNPAPFAPVCTDSDDTTPGTVNPSTYGTAGSTTLTGSPTEYDSCEEAAGEITEWYCPTSSTRSSTVYECQYGCTPNQNYCNSAPPTCTDTDGGKDYYEKGIATKGTTTLVDKCEGEGLYEYFCQDNDLYEEGPVSCAYGCTDGRCNFAPVTAPLSVTYSTTCELTTVTVTSEGDTVKGATVKVDGDSIGTTDSNGEVTFTECGKIVIISATKIGYTYDYTSANLASCCVQPSLECTVNSQCNADEFCSNNVCEKVTGTCGYALDHEWVSYSCCVDSDCSTNQKCEEHVCIQETQPECTIDSNCPDDSTCVDGSCKLLAGCGTIANHEIALYQCGFEVGCPTCSIGSCIDHICFVGDVTCESGKVGEQKTCEFTQSQTICALCDYQLTDPDGNITTGKTGQDGKLKVTLENAGVYKVALLKNGQVIKITNLVVTPKTFVDEPEKPILTDLSKLIGIIIVVLLLIMFLYIIFDHMRKKKED
ncbi:MAG: hypothetical protein ABID61_06105 [Candidatus Micrarchaeota archaeon]